MRMRIGNIMISGLNNRSLVATYGAMSDWNEWISNGKNARLETSGGRVHSLFYREFGAPYKPAIVFIHGFPTHSMDWAKVIPAFADNRVIVFDLLGFGASDKPKIIYSYAIQVELVLALFEKLALRRATIISHDYGVSVAQEMLAREAEGRTNISFAKSIFLNGGVFSELHQQQRIHKLLQTPILGRLIASLTSAKSLQRGLSEVAGADYPWSLEDARSHFQGMRHGSGKSVVPRLLHYIEDRNINAERWVGALKRSEAKVGFVWGPEDPVSGAHIARRIRSEFTADQLIELKGVGHYPHWGAPGRTAQAIRKLL